MEKNLFQFYGTKLLKLLNEQQKYPNIEVLVSFIFCTGVKSNF
jgi:hypothetical protein